MKQQVYRQLSIEQLPASVSGITHISGIHGIIGSIFNIIINIIIIDEKLVA